MVDAAGLEWLFGPLGDAARAAGLSEDSPMDALREVNAEAADRLALFAKLGGGWLDDESLPPTPRAIETTARLLVVAHRLHGTRLADPFLVPAADGSVQVVWKAGVDTELVLVVPPSASPIRFVMDLPDGSGGVAEWDGNIPADGSLADLLSRLL